MAFIRYTNRVDRYTKVQSTNAAGQKFSKWVYKDTLKTIYMPFYTLEKLNPSNQELDMVHCILDGSITINYSDRFMNFVDRKGRQVDPGPYQMMEIKNYVGFSGSKRHVRLILKEVEEV